MRKIKIIVLVIFVVNFSVCAHAFVSNGDFENGDLSGYFYQEDLVDVASSPLVKVVDDGTGNHVGEISTGFTFNDVLVATIGRDLGTLPSFAQNILFDFKMFDAGADPQGNGNLPDTFTVTLQTDSGDVNHLVDATVLGNTIGNPGITQLTLLSNGFYRATTNISSLQNAANSKLFFDLLDDDDTRLSKVWVDNLALTNGSPTVTPEPSGLVLYGVGALAIVWVNRKRFGFNV